jgi:hypothetical protein
MEKSECNYNLNEWKTFVLKELCNLNEASLIDTIWNRLKVNQKVPESDRKAHYLYTDLVLKCLEDEHGLIRTEKNGIQITTEGKYVASLKGGFSEYINSSQRHKKIVKWNDYIQFATTLVGFISGIIALLNLIFDWWNKSFSLFVMGAIIILTVALFIYKRIK